MAASHPRVRFLATGGTIAMMGLHRLDYISYSETGQILTAEQSLARIPEAKDVAEVQYEDLLSVRSQFIGPREWLEMAHRINDILGQEEDVAGVVLTHGTATLEETAYFLHLTTKSSRPVVVTGAMRSPITLGTDADVNLLDAIRVAACPEARGKGVLTVLNDEIQSAREVRKTNNARVETFGSGEMGFLGYVDHDGQVVLYREPTRKHTVDTPFDVAGLRDLPRVDVVYSYAGADTLLVDAVRRHGSDGLVLVGFGGGGWPLGVIDAAAKAIEEGITVVLASRATAGRLLTSLGRKGLSFIECDDLLPQKARILLMLALTVTRDRDEIQRMFREF